MLNQKQINQKVKEEFQKMEGSLNKMEEELIKEHGDCNQSLVALHFGKIQEQYMLIIDLLGIFDEAT